MIIINKCPKCSGTLVLNQNIDGEEELRCVNCSLSTPTVDNFHKLTGKELLMMLIDKANTIAAV
tara:strand:- start:364 stop:555 length:192 start_codon:yes stop_codon:yes gene_type:complete